MQQMNRYWHVAVDSIIIRIIIVAAADVFVKPLCCLKHKDTDGICSQPYCYSLI